MKSVTIQAGQTALDLCIQHSGSIESLFESAEASGAKIVETLEPGNSFLVDDSAAVLKVLNYYSDRKLSPATPLPAEAPTSGIGFIVIGSTFIVA